MNRPKIRKKPCRICRRWFVPDVRQTDRQKTCKDPKCRKEWHRRQSAKWNKRNKKYFKENYLQQKLERISHSDPNPHPLPLPHSRIQLNLPRKVIKDTIGLQHLIIIEYIVEQIVRRKPSISSHFKT